MGGQQEVLCRRLAWYLRKRTHGHLRLLSLEAAGSEIVIRCQAEAYYPVQLAIAAILGLREHQVQDVAIQLRAQVAGHALNLTFDAGSNRIRELKDDSDAAHGASAAALLGSSAQRHDQYARQGSSMPQMVAPEGGDNRG